MTLERCKICERVLKTPDEVTEEGDPALNCGGDCFACVKQAEEESGITELEQRRRNANA